MKHSITIIKLYMKIVRTIILASLLVFGFGLSLNYFTDIAGTRPISAASISETLSRNQQYQLFQAANPVANGFINAIPGADGTEVFVSVRGINGANNSIILTVDPGSGGGNHKDGYTMTLSGTTYLATATGFAPGQDVGNDGDDTMSITTTVGSQVMGTGEINFERAFVQPTQPEMISLDNGDFILEILNTGSVLADTYVMVMSTNAPPSPLPFGYQLVGKSYNVRPSGSLTQTQKTMTLNFHFNEPLPGGNDPHTLTILRWNSLNQVWENIGGRLLNDSNTVTLSDKRFGIYALATAPIWRDSFAEVSLSGVSALSNTQRGPGQTIILNNATSGSVTTIPITPTDGDRWGTLHFSATVPPSTTLTVDILDVNNTIILTKASDGLDLSSAGVDIAAYPSLKLRANLSAASVGLTPQLHEWSLAWSVEEQRVYLPLIVK
jgi:hypothetical protein